MRARTGTAPPSRGPREQCRADAEATDHAGVGPSHRGRWCVARGRRRRPRDGCNARAYQPANRYWIFQGAEGALRIVLAALLVVASIRRINGPQPLTSPLPLSGLLGLPPKYGDLRIRVCNRISGFSSTATSFPLPARAPQSAPTAAPGTGSRAAGNPAASVRQGPLECAADAARAPCAANPAATRRARLSYPPATSCAAITGMIPGAAGFSQNPAATSAGSTIGLCSICTSYGENSSPSIRAMRRTARGPLQKRALVPGRGSSARQERLALLSPRGVRRPRAPSCGRAFSFARRSGPR